LGDRTKPTPHMEKPHFELGSDTDDPDRRVLADQDLESAKQEGDASGG